MNTILNFQKSFLASKSITERKPLGQYFTSGVIASYMASLLELKYLKPVRILDAGAGSGILGAAAAMACLNRGIKDVHVVAYEIDPQIIPYLESTLDHIQKTFLNNKATFSFEIVCQDFVLHRPDKRYGSEFFDVAVINPPYFKYSVSESPYAKATADLYKGDPNIYASFMAIVIACLAQSGQMVSISPRSFTNGLYFKGFRNYILEEASLDLIHVFKHRNKVFKDEFSSVLQENVICLFTKGHQKPTIRLRTSECSSTLENLKEDTLDVNLLIDSSNDHKMIRMPESTEQLKALELAEKLNDNFESVGYLISTGPVVEHRTRDFITGDISSSNGIPLYRPHNVTSMVAKWEGNHRKDVVFMLNDGYEKHTLKNTNYVLLKRFTSKDEKRRLVAGVHLKEMHDTDIIGFGNKTNYIRLRDDFMSENEAYGLAAVFNSSFMENYFRCISGNTQVNSTEIRVMKFPHRDQIIELGRKWFIDKPSNQKDIDQLVNSVLPIT